jgi:hypothetical protein
MECAHDAAEPAGCWARLLGGGEEWLPLCGGCRWRTDAWFSSKEGLKKEWSAEKAAAGEKQALELVESPGGAHPLRPPRHPPAQRLHVTRPVDLGPCLEDNVTCGRAAVALRAGVAGAPATGGDRYRLQFQVCGIGQGSGAPASSLAQ